MRKIPTVFLRDPDNMARVLEAHNPECEWVLAGEGVATRKYDGTCMMLDGAGTWWARREVKPGKQAPAAFQPIETDLVTGKMVGWIPAQDSPFAKFWVEAVDTGPYGGLQPGTYELIGPKINGNPEKVEKHTLIRHADAERRHMNGPLTYETIRAIMATVGKMGWEGIVWHHPDGRMAKLKVKDFQ
jgi:hypothetical protein